MYLIFPLFNSKIITILAQNCLDQNHEMTVLADFGAKTQIFGIFYTKKGQLLHKNNIANISSFWTKNQTLTHCVEEKKQQAAVVVYLCSSPPLSRCSLP